MITDRIDEVRQRMRTSSILAHRDVRECSLMCVAKFQDQRSCLEALRHGERLFGENRVQEAAEKWPPLREWFPDARVHMIGQLQSNKCDLAVRTFDCIQSVDRPKLVRAVAEANRRTGRDVPIMIQVNVGREAQKGGCDPSDASGLVNLARDSGLRVVGLMCVPPAGASPNNYFEMLRRERNMLGLLELSMGMSADVEAAIEYGSTQIRVGSAIFGARAATPAVSPDEVK